MTQNPPGAHPNGSLSDRLDGWKAIAAYLGRGVRTAQRWERELGLPVRRMDTGGAEVVYALPGELDEWLLRQTRVGAGEGEPASDRPRASAFPRRLWFVVAGVLVLAGAFAVWALGTAPRGAGAAPPGEPAALDVAHDTLLALDASGAVLWPHTFAARLDDFDLSTEGGRLGLRRRSAIGDFRLTGRNDVLLARSSERDPQLYWFDDRGTLVRAHRVDRTVMFGRTSCTATRFSALFAGIDAGHPQRFWVAAHEIGGEFPAVLQSLDSDGSVRSEYWSAGYIGAVAVVRSGQRRFVLVGAVANEERGASLAVFEDEANGSSPAADPAYRCSGCPPGKPLHYFVFPRSRLQAEAGQNAQVTQFVPASDGAVRVRVTLAGFEGSPFGHGSAYYTFDSAFRLVDAELNDDVLPVQRAYESQGLATAATRFRGDADLWPVLRWNGTAYDRLDRAEEPAHGPAPAPPARR